MPCSTAVTTYFAPEGATSSRYDVTLPLTYVTGARGESEVSDAEVSDA